MNLHTRFMMHEPPHLVHHVLGTEIYKLAHINLLKLASIFALLRSPNSPISTVGLSTEGSCIKVNLQICHLLVPSHYSEK